MLYRSSPSDELPRNWPLNLTHRRRQNQGAIRLVEWQRSDAATPATKPVTETQAMLSVFKFIVHLHWLRDYLSAQNMCRCAWSIIVNEVCWLSHRLSSRSWDPKTASYIWAIASLVMRKAYCYIHECNPPYMPLTHWKGQSLRKRSAYHAENTLWIANSYINSQLVISQSEIFVRISPELGTVIGRLVTTIISPQFLPIPAFAFEQVDKAVLSRCQLPYCSADRTLSRRCFVLPTLIKRR